MSVVIVTVLSLPAASAVMSGFITAAAVAAAKSMGLELTDNADATTTTCVDLCIDNPDEVASGISAGGEMTFTGNGVTVEFYQDEAGRSAVRVRGNGTKAELRAIGETMAQRVVQQFAYHRIVNEMRQRNMNIVEEEVEQDGTVRMLVRVHHG
ncbi:MAG: DUF1257 domain-containing protein [Planctomycetes bacterium]|nr:DUF1257 domain-containing protein [Planctomycetota bacterium]